MNRHPFIRDRADKPLIAVQGLRGGYIQLAAVQPCDHYENLPEAALLAARNWAARLEELGAERVYWITLSEVVRHLHIHLYPRWPEDTLRGLPLFEQREQQSQPTWSESVTQALADWAEQHQVLIEPADGDKPN